MTSGPDTPDNRVNDTSEIIEKPLSASKTNVVLIGFMGAGKTTIGKILARELNLGFLETDKLIQEQTGKSMAQIFETSGELTFRELEIRIVKEISNKEHFVIACGGGIVLNTINIERLRQRGIIVYLYATEEETIKRIKQDVTVRPLISVRNGEMEVRSLMKFRRPLYKHYADLIINTSNKDVNLIAKNIVNRLKKNESLDI